MIEPWQVWLTDFNPYEGHEQGGVRPAVVISSEFHLAAQQGRGVIVCPLTTTDRRLRTRVRVENPKGEHSFVITDQPRYVSTRRFERSAPWWQLSGDEIEQVQRALRLMVNL